MTEERIDVPEFVPGDHCVRYRGPDLLDHAIRTGDVLVVDSATTATPGRLVVATDADGKAKVTPFEDGMTVLGVVTGLMRRIDG